MRPKMLNFEQLVQQNKQELLEDEKRVSQLELRWEKRQEKAQKEQNSELSI